MDRYTVELIVANKCGVLNRITSLYTKRGYNIDTLNVSQTSDPEYSRMFIVSQGDEHTQIQTVRQLSKLYDVKKVTLMSAMPI